MSCPPSWVWQPRAPVGGRDEERARTGGDGGGGERKKCPVNFSNTNGFCGSWDGAFGGVYL